MTEYQEKEKKIARQACIEKAILSLTQNRTKEQDLRGWELRTELIAYYLYPKMFLESNDENNNLTEGVVHELDIHGFIHLIQQDAKNYYGQFITRVLIDSASVTVPYESFAMQDGIFNKFFTISNHQEFEEDISKLYHFDDEGNSGDIIIETANYPLLFTIDYLDSKRYRNNCIRENQEFQKFANSFFNQLLLSTEGRSRFKKLEEMLFLMHLNFVAVIELCGLIR